MSKKRFYSKQERNQHWTEPETGRVIDFAEKYIEGNSSDMYDNKRAGKNSAAIKAAARRKKLVRFGAVLGCLVLIAVGFIAADVHMYRLETPVNSVNENTTGEEGGISSLLLDVKGKNIESISLDSSVMLSSVINDTAQEGYTGVVFDAKRSDGTIGYNSSLALVDTFGNISAPASHLKASVSELKANDLLPVARVCCYLDNTAPALSPDMALKVDKKTFKDDGGNTYLDPTDEAVYTYIKNIIHELNGVGVDVFLLTGCSLPKEAESEGGGFKALSERLNKDFGGSVRLYEEVSVKLTGKTSDGSSSTSSALKKEIASFPKLKDNQIYTISSKLPKKRFESYLNKQGIESYIIIE